MSQSNGLPTTTQPELSSVPDINDADEQLRLALELSRQQEEDDAKRRKQEEEELELILKLSLQEK